MRTKTYTVRAIIPTRAEVDAAGQSDADPRRLCANWRKGCNGVTDGPAGDRLTLCDDCRESVESE
jgi:hypothetical protein